MSFNRIGITSAPRATIAAWAGCSSHSEPEYHCVSLTSQRFNVSAEGNLAAQKHRRLKEMFAPVYGFIEREFGADAPAAWRL